MNIIRFGNIGCTIHVYKNAEDVAIFAASMRRLGHNKTWLNLTNGLEASTCLDDLNVPYDFCRFRSCSFEQKRWGDAIDSMPDDMLMRLALGEPQTIIDFGANRPCSRAMRQGIPIALRRLALSWGMKVDDNLKIFSRNGNIITCDINFTKDAMRLNKNQKSRVDYFGKYVSENTKPFVDIVCAPTSHDGNYSYYASQMASV